MMPLKKAALKLLQQHQGLKGIKKMKTTYATQPKSVNSVCYIVKLGTARMRVTCTHRGIIDLLFMLLPQRAHPGETGTC